MKKNKKEWWENKPLPEYVKLNGQIYQIDDAISLGKITDDTKPSTKEEYESFINQNKQS